LILADIRNENKVSQNEELNTESKQTYHIKFRNSQFLVLINRILAFFIAFTAIIFKERNRIRNIQINYNKSEPPLYQYIYCSLSNILSSWCQYEALKFVSFPTQVLNESND
jgi:adenosine 3'-phospho 5'-phosphosulfate transporter B2